MVLILPSPSLYNAAFKNPSAKPNRYLNSRASLNSLSSEQSIDRLITIFEKPMPASIGKKLVISALENAEISKLVSFPTTDNVQKGRHLSNLMKKYALNADDLNTHPNIKRNYIAAIEEATKPIYDKLFRQSTQSIQKKYGLYFGASYPRDRAERIAKATAIVGSFAAVNGGVNAVSPPFVDILTNGLSAVAMGAALGNLYGCSDSKWTIATTSQLFTMLAAHEAPKYLFFKTASWLSNFVGGPVTAAAVQSVCEGGTTFAAQAILGLATTGIFELQIASGKNPQFPKDVNSICRAYGAVATAMGGIGITNSLLMLAQGHGPQLLQTIIDKAGNALAEEAAKALLH